MLLSFLICFFAFFLYHRRTSQHHLVDISSLRSPHCALLLYYMPLKQQQQQRLFGTQKKKEGKRWSKKKKSRESIQSCSERPETRCSMLCGVLFFSLLFFLLGKKCSCSPQFYVWCFVEMTCVFWTARGWYGNKRKILWDFPFLLRSVAHCGGVESVPSSSLSLHGKLWRRKFDCLLVSVAQRIDDGEVRWQSAKSSFFRVCVWVCDLCKSSGDNGSDLCVTHPRSNMTIVNH